MTPAPARAPDPGRPAALDRLLTLSGAEDDDTLRAALDAAEAALAGATEPCRVAWRQVVAAHQALLSEDARPAVASARAALEECPPSAGTALARAYLAHAAVRVELVDAAMELAADAALLAADLTPSRDLLLAHAWLSRALGDLDLEEPAAEHALRGRRIAGALPDLADRWRAQLRCAQQHAELAQASHRSGDAGRARRLAEAAVDAATAARALDREPEPAELDLLDVVQAWAMSWGAEPEEALGPLRRVRRRVQADGGLWLRGYADLALARVLARGDRARQEESAGLLVDAAGEFAASGDRRRYRQCLLELGRAVAALGRPAEALHWLEAHRADAGHAEARTREHWAARFPDRMG